MADERSVFIVSDTGNTVCSGSIETAAKTEIKSRQDPADTEEKAKQSPTRVKLRDQSDGQQATYEGWSWKVTTAGVDAVRTRVRSVEDD